MSGDAAPAAGIAICTYNPDPRLLARTLNAVAALQLPVPVECVIVDNASDRAVAELPVVRDFLARCPWARVVTEAKPGLSYARIAAVNATTAPLLCFVDDDCEPASDYLAIALRILDDKRCIGALGPGEVVVEYVDPVPDWFAARFTHHFQEKHHDGLTYGCVSASWTDYYPPGSCMVVRREVLTRYRDAFLGGELSASDRTGDSLASGGDTQIVWEAVKLGFAAGISSNLRIRHLIPAKRSNLRYMKRLSFGTSSSYLPALIGSFPAERAKYAAPANAQIASGALKLIARHVLRMRLKFLPIELAAYLGRITGTLRATGERRRWVDRCVRLLGIIAP